ncbi:2-succinyl-5-enolpyruvyl-6-hydroxy-3-cyclohexene-1-carboxylic-acid synthase [Belliella kenyensis]|uniref:2-succinyl-5-enolpyruvyl-6-hydroxy-3-cyclohexene-1-carboxylate synthase n=1 Tax=Belliella kenyensis TaxID=1472724 RepID=A0ABV8ENJ6_9BACT|nr:2-succinyl-5-enolpyruvyl-6-hydroxy-3-cyclohexene-1-carboxylic-acid synthase [Belliella kenyensis]MCH7403023.1 2-succinyl-5-enolpyruvyl-6-hydroxy-3-cyclohexene-1-carboxylic-acid synthase [Belliella kenyensis]MDN3605059.1 2-succinyl-5-enolpyruvyl-6-hydroxy-3-cyclohexene-1-carboxylic-acid synthase [Belliella kenyensis]
MILQPILDLVSICAQKGIKQAILSPGSRCAPLTLAFARHPDIQCRTISDERSAAFIALGMAQQLESPVVLVCTSGSAAYNYAPAIAEAYFQQVPLIVITADRPSEWIDQWDGQTIRQSDIYGRHIKASLGFPDEFSHRDKVWHAHRIVNEAINLASDFPAGPVHINIPLREPFYPESGENFEFKNIRITDTIHSRLELGDIVKVQLKEKLALHRRIVIIPGQQRPNQEISKILSLLASNQQVVVVSDVISNMQSDHTITLHDHFINHAEKLDLLKPDLIISFGKSIISKGLKNFLRTSQAEHWHIQQTGYSPDTYQSLTKILSCDTESFLKVLVEELPKNESYTNTWKELDQIAKSKLTNALDRSAFGEFKAIYKILKFIPAQAKLHIANSMSIRYMNMLGAIENEIICNRGTSGIDGSNSTAVGCTFTTKDQVILITGDLAFFYDRNAFWHNYSISNLRVILLNNHAGGIFRLIEGPSKQAELEEFFETKQNLDASHLAKEFDFEYHLALSEKDLEHSMEHFFDENTRPKLIEIKTESPRNAEILKWIKREIL